MEASLVKPRGCVPSACHMSTETVLMPRRTNSSWWGVWVGVRVCGNEVSDLSEPSVLLLHFAFCPVGDYTSSAMAVLVIVVVFQHSD